MAPTAYGGLPDSMGDMRMDGNFTSTSWKERWLQGEEAAFREVYERYWSKVYDICYFYSRSHEESEDMLIDIFASVWQHRERIDTALLEHYLVRAAKNQAYKFLIRQERQRSRMRQEALRRHLQHAGADMPDLLLESKDLSGQLERRIQALPEKTRRIFLLSRESGLTYPEIALRLGISIKTVEYHISKALHSLSGYLLLWTACLTGFLDLF